MPAPTEENYAADRLGDDVLAVIAALKLDRPVVAGHSFAGEELSSIGSRHPEKVAGLIYLEAAGGYAFYDRAHGYMIVDFNDLRRRLDHWNYMESPADAKRRIEDLLQSGDLEFIPSDLKKELAEIQAAPPMPPGAQQPPATPETAIASAIVFGVRKYTTINAPVLAIFAVPHDSSRNPKPEAKAAAEQDLAFMTQQSNAFQAGVPTARVVRLPYANHIVWRSNEADVLREMNAFMDGLN